MVTGARGEAENVISDGLPLNASFFYPVLVMVEWHQPEEWTQMGLWDLKLSGQKLKRVPYKPVIKALPDAQRVERLKLRVQNNISIWRIHQHVFGVNPNSNKNVPS
jgi:hypothetical protein